MTVSSPPGYEGARCQGNICLLNSLPSVPIKKCLHTLPNVSQGQNSQKVTHINFIFLFIVLCVLTVLKTVLAKTHRWDVGILVAFDYNFTLNQYSFPIDAWQQIQRLNHIIKLDLGALTNFCHQSSRQEASWPNLWMSQNHTDVSPCNMKAHVWGEAATYKASYQK